VVNFEDKAVELCHALHGPRVVALDVDKAKAALRDAYREGQESIERPLGWLCPQCQIVWAPDTKQCLECIESKCDKAYREGQERMRERAAKACDDHADRLCDEADAVDLGNDHANYIIRHDLTERVVEAVHCSADISALEPDEGGTTDPESSPTD
jgi:hypothetical protein